MPRPALACLAMLVALCAAAPVTAKNIYKYQDENGIWHFTDRAPDDTEIEFETVFMEREREARVRLRQEGTKQNPLYYLFNDYWGPVQVELTLSDARNVLSEPKLPARFVVPGQKERLLVGLGPLDPGRGFRYRLNVATVPGPLKPTPVDGLVLRPPFAPDKAYPVSQGFDGGKTHLD